MTMLFRVSRLIVSLALAASTAVWAIHPWTTGGVSPFSNVNDAEGLAITIEDESVSSTGATLRFENATDREWEFGEEFWIEKKEDGEWKELKSLRTGAYNALSYLLKPHSTREEAYSFSDIYGHLTNGEYRLVKELLRERSGGWESRYLAAEFSVS